MGEARETRRRGAGGNGGPRPQGVRVVANIRVETLAADAVIMIILGDALPELAAALAIPDARHLAAALLAHAEALEHDRPRILTPPA